MPGAGGGNRGAGGGTGELGPPPRRATARILAPAENQPWKASPPRSPPARPRSGFKLQRDPAHRRSSQADSLPGQPVDLGNRPPWPGSVRNRGLSKTGTARGPEPGLSGQVTDATATLCVVTFDRKVRLPHWC